MLGDSPFESDLTDLEYFLQGEGKLNTDQAAKLTMLLVAKVHGIPLVIELFQITMLNTSYKLLSRILLKQLTRFLGTLLRSVQSCSKPGANICNSLAELVFTVKGIARQLKVKWAILSLDLLHAYDRINLSFLQKVMEAMNILEVFISWVILLHDSDTT